jgi:hypothetical protein
MKPYDDCVSLTFPVCQRAPTLLNCRRLERAIREQQRIGTEGGGAAGRLGVESDIDGAGPLPGAAAAAVAAAAVAERAADLWRRAAVGPASFSRRTAAARGESGLPRRGGPGSPPSVPMGRAADCRAGPAAEGGPGAAAARAPSGEGVMRVRSLEMSTIAVTYLHEYPDC